MFNVALTLNKQREPLKWEYDQLAANETLNRKFLNRWQKVGSDDTDATSLGRTVPRASGGFSEN